MFCNIIQLTFQYLPESMRISIRGDTKPAIVLLIWISQNKLDAVTLCTAAGATQNLKVFIPKEKYSLIKQDKDMISFIFMHSGLYKGWS